MTELDIDEIELNRLCWSLVYGLTDSEHGVKLQPWKEHERGEWSDRHLDHLEERYEIDEIRDLAEEALWAIHEAEVVGQVHGEIHTTNDTLQKLTYAGVDPVARAEAFAEVNDVRLVPIWIEDYEDDLDYDVSDIEVRAEMYSDGETVKYYTSFPEDEDE